MKRFAVNDLAGFAPVGSEYLKRFAGSVLGFPGFLQETGVEGLRIDTRLIESIFDLRLGFDSAGIISSAVVHLLCSKFAGQAGNDFFGLASEKKQLTAEVPNGFRKIQQRMVKPPSGGRSELPCSTRSLVPNENRDDPLVGFQRGKEARVVLDAQILAEPNDGWCGGTLL